MKSHIMRRRSEQIRALDGLYRDGHVTSAERAAAWRRLFPARITVWDGRLLWVLSALCLALTLFSVAALNLTLILQFFEAQLEWLTRRWFDILRWSSLIHVTLASLPLLLFAVLAAREPRAWVQQILLVLTMALVALPVIVTGQIYQVGANASGLFLVWACWPCRSRLPPAPRSPGSSFRLLPICSCSINSARALPSARCFSRQWRWPGSGFGP